MKPARVLRVEAGKGSTERAHDEEQREQVQFGPQVPDDVVTLKAEGARLKLPGPTGPFHRPGHWLCQELTVKFPKKEVLCL